MFSLDQKLTLESFHRHLLVVFFDRTNIFEANEHFLKEIPIITGSVEIK